MTAIYLLNRTPIKALGWKTPYEVVQGRKPSLAHLSQLGARAFTLNQAIKNGDKLESRALIGQLVGYDSTNIYRVWMPTLRRVIRTRDVVFLPRLSGDNYPPKQTLKQLVTILDIEEQTDDDDEEVLEQLPTARRLQELQQIDQEEEQVEKPTSPEEQGDGGCLPSPEATPEPDYTALESDQSDQASLPRGWQTVEDTQEAPDRASNNAPRREEISSQIDKSNIIQRKRSRKGRLPEVYMASFMSFIDQGTLRKQGEEPQDSRHHRDQLPPPPKRWKDLETHPFSKDFYQAAGKELDSCFNKGCFSLVAVTKEEI